MNKKLALLLAAAAVAILALTLFSSAGDADENDDKLKVLLDYGNGQTRWFEANGSTVGNVFKNALSDAGISFSDNDNVIVVNGKKSITIGGTECSWKYFVYDGGWKATGYDRIAQYNGSFIAIGYYPDGLVPTVTPEYKTAWTAIHGDALNSGSEYNYDPVYGNATLAGTYYGSKACYASPLIANGHAYLLAASYPGNKTYMVSLNLETAEVEWDPYYTQGGYEMATPCIYGGMVYFASVSGTVYGIPVDGESAGTVQYQKDGFATMVKTTGSTVMKGLSSIVYDSGHLFFSGSAGVVYCTDTELNIVWERQLDGAVYPSTSISVVDGLVYAGGCDGALYILDEVTGEIKTKMVIYYEGSGRLGTPAVIGDRIFVEYNDGLGMSCQYWGMAILKYNAKDNLLTYVKNLDSLTITGGYLVIPSTGNYVYALGMNSNKDNKVFRIYDTGNYEELFSVNEIHGGFTLVNDKYLYATEYNKVDKYGKGGNVVVYTTDGDLLNTFSKPSEVNQYTMGAVGIAGGYIVPVTDGGAFILKGLMVEDSSSDVSFVIGDGSKLYVTLKGNGETVMEAFRDSIQDYHYTDQVEYSGPSGSPTGIKSMFGLETEELSDGSVKEWTVFIWDSTLSKWVYTSESMADLFATENAQIMVYYAIHKGETVIDPTDMPDGLDLVPLTRTDQGTRFVIESPYGEYFVVNGDGSTVGEALADACTKNSIPYSISDNKVTFFSMSASEGYSWMQNTGTRQGWVTEGDLSSETTSPVYGFLYGTSESEFIVSPSDVYDFPVIPVPSTVQFLIEDGSDMYIVIEGTGITVMDALKDAVDRYNYTKTVTYSGPEDAQTNIASMFGLDFVRVDDKYYYYWATFQWDAAQGKWITATDTLNNLYAMDEPSMLLYYLLTDGMDNVVPDYFPKGNALKSLIISYDGTRFLIESSKGGYFVMNGTGGSILEALKSACSANEIPSSFDGEITLFNIAPKDGKAWFGYSGSYDGWSAVDPASSTSSPLYGFYYAGEGEQPTVSSRDVYNFPEPGMDFTPYIIPVVSAVLILLIISALLIIFSRRAEERNMTLSAYVRDISSFKGEGSKVHRNKVRLAIVCSLGLIATFVMFLCNISIGPTVTLSIPDAFSALLSALGKDSSQYTVPEIIVFETRLPRALAAVAVGIGLSIAGCVYQAIIRNPLVDPYIMGVSSGAGTFAIAAIAFNFTFFGILANNNFAVPIMAAMGGLLAFGLTLLIAHKAGGSATSFVLAGVIVGLVFSAVQTFLLITSNSDKITGALSWLFGSFANVGWSTAWLVFFPALFLSLIPLFWAKELNMILLGEEQAKQMGLNVKRFNVIMLVLASVLTSVCVAFVGIIGFVGMVIPHLCRMILGSDHRLVLPASIMMGGALMLFADLLAKLLMAPTELPVGAITTVIGVPVFAYLLIKRGRMYDG